MGRLVFSQQPIILPQYGDHAAIVNLPNNDIYYFYFKDDQLYKSGSYVTMDCDYQGLEFSEPKPIIAIKVAKKGSIKNFPQFGSYSSIVTEEIQDEYDSQLITHLEKGE